MEEISDKCMKEATTLIENLTKKYSVTFGGSVPSNQNIASNVLIGNVAFSKYQECVQNKK